MENKAKGSFLVLVVAIAILSVGYFVLTTVNSSIDGQNDYYNATASTSNTVFSIVNVVVLIGAVIACIGLVSYYVSTPERYKSTNKHIIKILEFLDVTTYYFAYGLLAIVCIGVPSILIYLAYRLVSYSAETGVGVDIGKWVVIVIGLYFGIAALGYLFKKKIWDKWRKRKLETKEAEYKTNLKYLPGLFK